MNLMRNIIILLVISFCNVGHFFLEKCCVDSFYNLESNIREKSIFVENGVKCEYMLKNNEDTELKKIDKVLLELGFEKECCNDSPNNSTFHKNKQKIEINKLKEDDYVYINITIYNKDEKYKTKDLKKILYKINDKNLDFYECYSYYKGKTDRNIISELNNQKNLKDMNLIKINNGYTGVANLNSNEKINFAEVNYDTGSYIIIATPIIFITY